MSMADNPRYRSPRAGDPSGREEGSGGLDRKTAGGDPLAELARLIGREDALEHSMAAGMPQRDVAMEATREPVVSPVWATRPAVGLDDPASDTAGRGAGRDDMRRSDSYGKRPPPAVPDAYEGEPAYDSDPHDAEPGFNDPGASLRMPGEADAYDSEASSHYGDETYYGDEDELSLEGEEDYDDEADPPKRRGAGVIAVVLSLAALAAAGAFGYRSLTNSTTSDGEPPVIKAEPGPNKIVPSAPGADSQQKSIYDRVGDRPQSTPERVVSREEQPVDLGDDTKSGAARANSSWPPSTAGAPPAPPVSSPSLAAGGSDIEPKKVATIRIPREPSSAPPVPDAVATGSVPMPATTAPSPPTRSAMAQAALPPSLASVPPRPSPTPAKPRAPSPLTLAPQTGADSAEGQSAPPPSTRMAALPPASAAPTHSAAASAEGGYVVQVSSQRSDGEAQASFKTLQSKYPNVLGGRSPLIRRVDLGEKGVYYRAQVGPFDSIDQANQVCGSLKAAGGQCIVQKN